MVTDRFWPPIEAIEAMEVAEAKEAAAEAVGVQVEATAGVTTTALAVAQYCIPAASEAAEAACGK